MDPHIQQFLIAEFEALRREIEGHLAAERDLIPYVLIASSAIWTWLFTRKTNKPLPPKVGFIAPLLSVLFAVRAYTLGSQIGRIGDYIVLLESKLGVPSGLGWETQLRSHGWFARTDVAVDILWVAIIGANTYLAWVYWKSRTKDEESE